jgi:CBS domain-containing protein
MQVAKDIMRRQIITISPDITVGESIDILIENGISGLPVVDGSGTLVGMITEFALLAAAYDEAIKSEPVSRHMTREILSIGPESPIRAIADKFIVHRIRRVPVLENGKLIGSISRRDVLRAIQQERSESNTVNAV